MLLVLNSLYWSVEVNHNPEILQKAVEQLTWLEAQLEIAAMRGKKVILVSHIPAGYVEYCNRALTCVFEIVRCCFMVFKYLKW